MVEYNGCKNKPRLRLSIPVMLTWWGSGTLTILFWGIIAFMLFAWWTGGLE